MRRMTGALLSAPAARVAADALTTPSPALVTAKTRTFRGTGGELIAEQLLAFNTRFIFAGVSSGMGPLEDALVDRPQLQFIQGLHENVVTGMASGYSMALRKPSFASFSRVGMPLGSSNVYNSIKDRTGLVILTDHVDVEAGGRDGHEDLDNWLATYTEFTKGRWICNEGSRITEWLSYVTKLAWTAPQGPTLLRIPRNVLYSKYEEDIFPEESVRISTKLTPDSKTVVEAARMLIEASSPLLFVGPEVSASGSGARQDLVELSESLGIPVTQAISCSADFPTDHPLFLGGYFNPMRFPAEIDLFLCIGAKLPDQGAGSPAIPRSAKIIHASHEAGRIGTGYPVDVPILGDCGETIRALRSAANGLLSSERMAKIGNERMEKAQKYTASARRAYQIAARACWDRIPMTWPRALYEIHRALDRDAIVSPEIGTEEWLNRIFTFGDQRKTKIGRTDGRALGWGVPASIGIKLACPDQQVISLQGDGGFGFAQSEAFWTAGKYQIPIIVIIFNNGGYDEPRNNIMMKFGRCYQENKDMLCSLDPQVDYTMLARSYGMRGERAANPDELRVAMQRAVETTREGRPYLVDVLIGRTGLGVDSNSPNFSLAKTRVRKV
jgi:thiamine pyrophosphate-dependent acetolactate synthase large subunit-like protein